MSLAKAVTFMAFSSMDWATVFCRVSFGVAASFAMTLSASTTSFPLIASEISALKYGL
jgi:hypothetical protein